MLHLVGGGGLAPHPGTVAPSPAESLTQAQLPRVVELASPLSSRCLTWCGGIYLNTTPYHGLHLSPMGNTYLLLLKLQAGNAGRPHPSPATRPGQLQLASHGESIDPVSPRFQVPLLYLREKARLWACSLTAPSKHLFTPTPQPPKETSWSGGL